ncbi:MAG: hypothetical protein AB1730_07650 [Myxococcota bacterium]|jgi:hypothetical protein
MDELEQRAQAVTNALDALRPVTEGASRAHLDALARHVAHAIGRMRFRPVEREPPPRHPSNFARVPREPPPSFPSFVEARALGGPHAAAVRALLDALAAFQERLVFEADCQEYVDALNSSREFLFAAGHLDLAEPHALALAHQLARAAAAP